MIASHTPPESAVTELGSLHEVVEWARVEFPDEDDFVVLGDFNAGCDYATRAELDALALRGPSYFWIIPDHSDSNVSTGTACAYDRTTAETAAEFSRHWGIDRAFSDKAVSDHWPVWAEFHAQER